MCPDKSAIRIIAYEPYIIAMNKLRNVTLTLILIFQSAIGLLQANDYKSDVIFNMSHYTLRQGLPSNNVSDFIQDDRGLIWLSTWNGIALFDGYKFTCYNTKLGDSIRMANNRLHYFGLTVGQNIVCRDYEDECFIFDTNRRVYHRLHLPNNEFIKEIYRCGTQNLVRTSTGMAYYFDEKAALMNQPSFISISQLSDGRPISFAYMSKNNNLWILTKEGVYLNGQRLLTDNISGISNVDNDRIALCSANGLHIYNERNYKQQFYPCDAKLKTMYTDEQSHCVYLFGESRGIYRWDGTSITEVEYEPIHLDYTMKPCSFAFTLPDGTICFHPADGGFFYGTPSSQKLDKAELLCDGDTTDNHPRIKTFFVDKGKNVWIHDNEAGFKKITVEQHHYTMMENEQNDEPRAVMEDSEGRLWVGWKKKFLQQSSTITVYDTDKKIRLGYISRTGEITQDLNNALMTDVYCITEDHNHNIWIGTKFDGVMVLARRTSTRYDIHRYTYSDSEYGLKAKEVRDIAEDGYGRMWLATFYEGVNVADNVDDVAHLKFFNPENAFPGYPKGVCNKSRKVMVVDKNHILLATMKGLISFSYKGKGINDISFTLYQSDNKDAHSISGNDIRSICKTRDGRVYLSLYGNGVDQVLKKKNGVLYFRHIYDVDSFSSPALSLTEDRDSNLWLLTENSLIKFDSRLKYVGTYPAFIIGAEGTPLLSRKGEIFFPTENSLMHMHDATLHLSHLFPKVVFLSVHIHPTSGKSVLPEINRLIEKDNIIRLSSDERNITINLAAPDFSAPEQVSYAYRIKGYTNQWVEIGHQHSINVLYMPAGVYQLEVKTTNADGVWNDEIYSCTIDTKPLFRETWMWVAMWVFIVLCVAAGITWWLMKHYNRKQKEALEREITELKLKHDAAQKDQMFIQKVIDEIDENIMNDNFRIDMLAESNGIRRAVFNQKVKDIIGINPVDLVKRRRLHIAVKMLLEQKDTPVSAIAYSCGFTSPQYFNRVFKDAFGSTPNEYRIQKLNLPN